MRLYADAPTSWLLRKCIELQVRELNSDECPTRDKRFQLSLIEDELDRRIPARESGE